MDITKTDNTNTANDKNNLESLKKDNLESLKKDIEHLAERLGELKEESVEVLVNQLDNLSNVVGKFKDQGVNFGKDGLEELYSSTREHPLRNLVYAFGCGMIFCWLTKK